MKTFNRALLALLVTVATLLVSPPAHAGRLYFHAVQGDPPASAACTQVHDTAGTHPYYKWTCAVGNTSVFFDAWYPADAGTGWTPTFELKNESATPGLNSCWTLSSAVAVLASPGGSNYDSLTFGNTTANTVLAGSTVSVGNSVYIAGPAFTPFNGVNGINCGSTNCKDKKIVLKLTQNASCSSPALSSLLGFWVDYN